MNIPVEINCDRLVGPTYFFGGLAQGNLASWHARGRTSSPRQAALQGLKKIRWVYELTGKQLILPPQIRPDRALIRDCAGGDFVEFSTRFPQWVPLVMSGAFMWTANAATVIPSTDAADGKVHFFPANLVSNPHRAIEARMTSAILKQAFVGPRFVHHAPLPSYFSDEGAANQCRLFSRGQAAGFHLLVHGFSTVDRGDRQRRFWPRQSAEAHLWMATKAGLPDSQWMAAAQTARAIDHGVFHNDVICASHEHLLMVHEAAFDAQDAVLAELEVRGKRGGVPIQLFTVSEDELRLNDAVKSYVFNAQFVTDRRGEVHMLAPTQAVGMTDTVTARLKRDGGVDHLHAIDLGQSMENGGGPACLRLRIWLTPAEQSDVNPAFWATETLLDRLENRIRSDYPDALTLADLTDPKIVSHLARVVRAVAGCFSQ